MPCSPRLLALCFAVFLAAPAAAADHGPAVSEARLAPVSVYGNNGAQQGTVTCVTIVTTPPSGVAFSATMNGVELAYSIRQVSDGTYVACITIPPNSAGNQVIATAVNGSGQTGSHTIQVTT
ncbi:MAG TPA: hypothetical protein VEI02_03325 [Planctomycetota bacterium]|nr:hypothetical protein [Planctomycetota bacterium]